MVSATQRTPLTSTTSWVWADVKRHATEPEHHRIGHHRTRHRIQTRSWAVSGWLAAGLAGAGGSVGEGDLELGGGQQFQLPAGSVDEVVVAIAQQHQVLEFGQTEVAPVVDVVGVAPGDLAVTAGEPAATIAHRGGPEQIDRHGTGRSP